MLAEISPVYQTCKLLQMNKTDVTEITSICSSLNPLQVWTGDENNMATTLGGGDIVYMGVGGEKVDFIPNCLEGIKGYKEGSWKILSQSFFFSQTFFFPLH